MIVVLLYILTVLFVVLPATLIYGIIVLVGHRFTSTNLWILGVGGALIVLALILFLAFGKKLIVK